MKLYKSLIVGISFIMTQFSFAVPQSTLESVPKNLHIYSQYGSTYVDHLATGCSGSRYYLPTDHEKYETVISILLAAQMGGKKVQLRFDGCNTNNQGKIIGVYLK